MVAEMVGILTFYQVDMQELARKAVEGDSSLSIEASEHGRKVIGVYRDIADGEFLEARPVPKELIIGIAQQTIPLSNRKKFLHNRLLYADITGEKKIWWFPRKVRKIEVINEEGGEVVSLKVDAPAGVFYQSGRGSLSIYAIKESRRPDEETDIYTYPLPNVNSTTGNVCMGDVNTMTLDLEGIESAFFLSKFTSHDNTLWHNGRSVMKISLIDHIWEADDLFSILPKHGKAGDLLNN